MTSEGEPGHPGRPTLDPEVTVALLAELASKSDLVWVQVDETPARPLWSIWHDDAIAIVTGGIEQRDPGLADRSTVTVILRSKENRARQMTLRATVEQLVADSESWDAAVKSLHPKRLNAPDGELQPERWKRESTIWLLHPTADVTEQPGTLSNSSHRAEPLASDATTLTRKPFHAGRATKKRR